MINGHEQMKRFATAARALMEMGHVDVDAGIFSKTLFMSADRHDADIDAALLWAAGKQGLGIITLEFGPTGRSKGPRSYTVSFPNDGDSYEVVHGCMLAHDADGAFVLVPRSTTYHFAIGSKGLERRHGRPSDVASGMIRASRALAAAAKHADRNSPFFDIHRVEDVA